MFDIEMAGTVTEMIGSPDMWDLDWSSILTLLLRFIANLVVTTGIIRFFYYPRSRRRDYFFSFILTSSTIFMLLFLLDSVKIQVGFALGLFAIFGILRYRTDTLPVREMTYLFMIIGISVINALEKHIGYPELILTNLIFIFVSWGMESSYFLSHVSSKNIIYEKIELIKPEKEEELLSDLRQRTGIDIDRVEIGSIDFLRDTAILRLYYKSESFESADQNTSKRFRDRS